MSLINLLHPSLESIESPPSDDGSPTCEWALVCVIGSNQMGSEARKAELEKIKQRKIEHGMLLLTIDVLYPINIFLLPHAFLPSFHLLFCLPFLTSPSLLLTAFRKRF